MKIRAEREKIVKAVQKLEGIEIVLENTGDAKEAIDLILSKPPLFQAELFKKIKDIVVTVTQEYKTSAVDYNMIFTLEFCFEDSVATEQKVAFIRELQDFFKKL